MSTLHQISGCTNDQRRADVIFIHGLGGDALSTWLYEEGKSWPHWLGADFPDVGVWSLSYASSPTKWLRALRLFGRGDRDSGHSMPLSDRAGQVLDSSLQKGIGRRPIFFICHSLGGLLAKQILRKAADSSEPAASDLWHNVAAVMFVATPHSGAPLASLLTSFRTIFATTVSMDDLKEHDAHLRDLNDWFCEQAGAANVRVESYFEMRGMMGVMPIVTPSSANCGIGKRPVALDEDHISIAKPRSTDAQVYCAARDILRTYILDPSRGSGHQPAKCGRMTITALPEAPRKPPLELPPRAERFMGRQREMVRVVQRLQQGRNTAIVGPAGLGKTALAAEALLDVTGGSPDSLSASPYPDGIVFLDLYKLRADAQAFWTALANKVAGVGFMPGAPARLRSEEACRARHLLVVVEGAEEAHGEEGRTTVHSLLDVLSAENRWLVLTRLRNQATAAETVEIKEPLEPADAAALLDHLTGGRLETEIALRTLALTGGHPLALTWASGLLGRDDDDPSRLVSEWENEPLGELNDPTHVRHTLDWLFERSARGISEPEARVLAAAGLLAYAPFDLAPMAAAQGFSDEDSLRESLKSLINRGFLQRAGSDSWRFTHVLTYQFARKRKVIPDVFDRLERWMSTDLLQRARDLVRTDGRMADRPPFFRLLEHANAVIRADVVPESTAHLVNSLHHVGTSTLVYLGWPSMVKLALSDIGTWMDNRPDEWLSSRIEHRLAMADALLKQGLIGDAVTASRDAERLANRLIDNPSLDSQFLNEHRRRMYLVNTKVCIGDTLLEIEKTDEAVKVYEDALALRRTIPEISLDISALLQKLAWANRTRRDWDAALGLLQQALREIDVVAEEYPNHLSVAGDRFRCQMRIANLLVQKGRFSEALGILHVCLDDASQHAQLQPSNDEWPATLSDALRNAGDTLRHQGDLDMALAYYNDACELIEHLVEKKPSNSTYLGVLSDCHDEIAELLRVQANPDAAFGRKMKAIELMRRLVSLDPTDASRQHTLATTLEGLGDIQRLRNDKTGALASYQESLEIAKDQPGPAQATPYWQRRTISVLDSIATMQLENDESAAALAMYRESLAITEQCAKTYPETPSWMFDLCLSKRNLAEALQATGDPAAALAAYRDAADTASKLAARDPTNSKWQRRMAVALENVADAVFDTNLAEALELFQRSLAISRDLAAHRPTEDMYQRDLGVDLHNVGRTLAAMSDAPSAIAVLEKALIVRRRLAPPDLDDDQRIEDLQRTLAALPDVYQASGNEIEAKRVAAEKVQVDARLSLAMDPPTDFSGL